MQRKLKGEGIFKPFEKQREKTSYLTYGGTCTQRWVKGPIDRSPDTDSIFRLYRSMSSYDFCIGRLFRFLYRAIVSVYFTFRFFHQPILFLGFKFGQF